mmetsp:Transcript_57082/g.98334  ORF Transcript_57082/g.98334 Transcript_57082/m.98334 type:complete len:243 (+) Transcript_57082:1-729(+)
MHCLHRFCSECIEKCLRIGRKECPSCRIHVPSRRSLRPDANFDAVIHKIYPSLTEYEANEEKLIQEVNKSRNTNNAFTVTCRQGIQNQLRRRKSAQTDVQPSGGKRSRTTDEGASKSHENLVHFVLRRHPNEKVASQLERIYMRTSADVKMENLDSYLATKLGHIDGQVYQIIYIAGPSADLHMALAGSMSIGEVCESFWDRTDDLVLYYRVSPRQRSKPSLSSTESSAAGSSKKSEVKEKG